MGEVSAKQSQAQWRISSMAGTFTQEVLKEMARINEWPIVFVLSNPVSKAECSAQGRWTYRRAKGRDGGRARASV
jgi:malic enzyme